MNPGLAPATDTVTVYYFETYDPETAQQVPSAFKSTRTEIEHTFAGVVLEGTAEVVSFDELDDQHRYRRVATGWGALD